VSTERTKDAGFTLLEVLVALTILAVAFGVTIAAIGPALHRIGTDVAERNAITYAQSLMARVGADVPLVDGTTNGRDGNLSWSVGITPWLAPWQKDEQPNFLPLRAHMVKVSVSWPGPQNDPTLSMSTVRLETLR
jgi:general secretion pathway protein I